MLGSVIALIWITFRFRHFFYVDYIIFCRKRNKFNSHRVFTSTEVSVISLQPPLQPNNWLKQLTQHKFEKKSLFCLSSDSTKQIGRPHRTPDQSSRIITKQQSGGTGRTAQVVRWELTATENTTERKLLVSGCGQSRREHFVAVWLSAVMCPFGIVKGEVITTISKAATAAQNGIITQHA